MQSKGQKCANYEYNQKEAERNVKRMKTLRKSELYREKEMVQKRTKHHDASFKNSEHITQTKSMSRPIKGIKGKRTG